MRTTWRMNKINKSLWTCNDWVIYVQRGKKNSNNRTKLCRRYSVLCTLIVSITFRSEIVARNRVLIGLLLLLCSWFYSIVMTIDDFAVIVGVWNFFFIHSRNMTLLYLWPLNRKSICSRDDNEENFFRWKWTRCSSSINETIFFVMWSNSIAEAILLSLDTEHMHT